MSRCRICETEYPSALLADGLCQECRSEENANAADRSISPTISTHAKISKTSGRLLLPASVAVVAVLVVGGYWFVRQDRIGAAYVAALADCEAGRGSAGIRALEKMYGEDSRPRALSFDLSMCEVDESIVELERLNRVLGLP